MFMKKQNKKRGFTITELVVVISVIAILSAVLIPTFSGIIAKSKMSADQQAVRQMNVQLSTITEEDAGFETVLEVLDEAGYNVLETLVPTSKGHAFYWDNEAKIIVLVDADKNVVYPKDHKNSYKDTWLNLRDDGVKAMPNLNVTETTDLVKALELGAKKVTLEKDLKITKAIDVAENAKTVINLNGNDLDASNQDNRPFNVYGNTTLTINATGSTVNVGRYGLIDIKNDSNAKVELVGGTYYADEDSSDCSFIKVRNATADITLTNVTYIEDKTSENYVVSGNEKTTLTVTGGSYKAKAGFICGNGTFTNTTIETKGLGIEVDVGSATFTGCTFKSGTLLDAKSGVQAAAIGVGYSATVTLSNCTIEAAKYGLSILPGKYDFDGSITATNLTFVGTPEAKYYNYDNTAVGYIEVDGTVVLGSK